MTQKEIIKVGSIAKDKVSGKIVLLHGNILSSPSFKKN